MLDLVSALRREFGTTVLFISHNLDVIARMCDRVGVLYAGRLVEEGPVAGGVRRPAPSVRRRPAALPAARRRAQGPRAPRHDPGLPPAARRATCRRACSSTAAGWPRTSAGARSRRSSTLGDGRHSRCHFWEQAHELPRAAPAAGLRSLDRRSRRAGHPHRGPAQDLPPGGPRRPRRRRRLARAAPRRDPRPGGRVGQRQDHARARAPRASPPPIRARSSSSTASCSRPGSTSATPTRSAPCRSSSRTPTRR